MNFEKLELELLERTTERFSRFTQRWIGVDCFDLAETAVYTSTTTIIFRLWFIFHTESYKAGILPIIVAILLLRVNFNFLRKIIPMYRQLCEQDVSQGLQNRFKIILQRGRIWIFALSVPISLQDILTPFFSVWSNDNIKWFLYGLSVLIMQQQFSLVSCTPLPPTESKLRKGVKALRSTLSGVFSPEPTGSTAG